VQGLEAEAGHFENLEDGSMLIGRRQYQESSWTSQPDSQSVQVEPDKVAYEAARHLNRAQAPHLSSVQSAPDVSHAVLKNALDDHCHRSQVEQALEELDLLDLRAGQS